jgi:Ca2+:H+ antiporter
VLARAVFAVVRHAEHLAVKLGEPYGTLILTLSVTSIEVMVIAGVMLIGDHNPTFARDTLFAVMMIVLNGMVGLTLLLGGIRYREQEFNLQGANAYLAAILPLAVFAFVMPSFTRSTIGPTLSTVQSAFLIVMAIALYAIFLGIQTVRHRTYFMVPASATTVSVRAHFHKAPAGLSRPVFYHAIFLIANLIPVVYLSKKLAVPIDYAIEGMGAPVALGGFLVAAMVLSPEGVGAVRAALANQLQRSVNIYLGSVLATIGLSIPAVLVIALLTNTTVVLGLGYVEMIMLLLTLVLCILTFGSGRTNVLHGAVHFLLFVAYVVLIFD